MKNSNLIERLLSDSHEKQSPLRFGRYAVMLILLLTLGVGQMWADDNSVVGVACNNTSSYTVKLNVNRKGDGDDWQQKTMSKAGITFEGKKLYITSYENKYSGLGKMQFQYYDGSTYKGQKEPISSWTSTTHNEEIYNYDGSSWYSTQTVETSARFYFDASGWEQTSIKLVVGHANYQRYSSLTNVTNTKLYYGSSGNKWTNAMGIGVVGNTSASDGTNWLTNVSSKASEYTGFKNYGLTATSSGNAYLMVNNGKAGEEPTMHYNGSHTTLLNSTQTIKYAVGVNGGTPATLTSGYVPADIAISSYKFSSGKYNAVDASSGSVTLSKGGSNYSATVTAARTATTTYTVSNVHEDYSFLGWYSAPSGGTLLSSELSYTFYPTSATTAYARFSKENNHTVTISRYCTSTSSEINSTSAKIGEVTYSSIEAPEIYGYTFVNWTFGSGVTKHSSDALTSNPIHVITAASGDYTLTANYTEVLTTDWKLIGDNTTNSPFGDNYNYASGKAMTKKSGYSTEYKAYKTLDITKTGTWGFKVASSSASANIYGWGTGETYITFNRSKSGSKQDVYSGSQHQLKFNPDGLGEYEFKVDYTASPCSVTVTFPTVYTVTFSRGTVDGASGTVTAEYSSVAFSTGTKVQSGKSVTFKAPAAKTGYTFQGWYTVNNGSGSTNRVSTEQNYTTTITADKTLYACYTINNHNISYTAPSNGSYTIKVGDAAAVSTNTTSDYGKTITLSATRNWGYDFTGWTVTKDGGGSITPSSSASSNPATFSMPDDNVTVSATFTAKNCTITLNNQGADSGKEGTTSVSTTYNTNTNLTSDITCPTKTGWKFQGYWSNTNGNGVQVIAADGSWISTVSGYMYEGKWVADGSATLYAYWVKASTYTFRYGTSGSEDWNGTAFTQVDATTTWQIENFTIPNKPNFYVGYEGLFYESGLGTGEPKSKSVTRAWTDAPAEVSGTYQGQMVLLPAGPTAGAIGQATGATGTLKIYSDSKNHNLYVGFEPSGYGVTRASGTLPFVNSSGTWRETNVVTLNSSDASGTFQVKLKTSSSYVATAHGMAENASAVNGRKITGDADIANGKKGVFQMWTDATSNNFGLRFVTVHDVTFNMQGHGSAISKYTDVRYNSKIGAPSAPSQTGYTFGGWYKEEGCTNAWDFDNDVITAATTLYAKWTPKTYTVTLDQQSGATGYGSSGDGSLTAAFDAAFPSAAMPTAANGYAFMGYWSAAGGTGTQFTDASGNLLANIDSYSDASGNWIYAGDDLTLYAYYKKAEITNLVAAPGVIAPGETITITPTIEPTPTGTTKVCWEVQYSNGTPLPSQPTFTPGVGNAVSFPVPSASATYIIQAKLAKGSDCPADPEDVLSTRTTTFQVAGAHDVTVKYMCGDLTIKASEVLGEIRPLTWSEDITAPTITGYTFARWDAGDGVTIKDDGGEDKTTSTSSTIKIKAVYDGTLTAVYNKKNMIYFNNTLGWSDVYVYFYSSDKYWVEDHIAGQGCGTGSDKDYSVGGSAAYYRGYHGHMTQIAGTNIWYYDYEAEHGAKDGGEIKGYEDVVFVETEQNNFKFFYNNNAARRGDFKHSLPMFVPINSITETKNGTKYYSSGYWMNYPENTGYSLLIYNQKAKAGATKLYELPFEYTEDKTMPMELVMDLEAGQTYGFEIKRADGEYYGNTGTMTANTTNWSMEKDKDSYCGLQTTAAGNYTFRFYYSSSNYRMDVTYPVAVNDYRIVYTDLATWSKDAHTASWNHPSRVITKNSSATEVKKDTVSFFWTYGSTPAIKYQTCTAVAAGSASWSAGTAIDVSGFSSVLTKKGVYNFIFEQPAGGASISLVGVEPYTGNYYIRTDCAGSSKWTNYRSTDHEMTYSEYTETNHGYSHYFPHWVTTGQNVKFVIANDYSPCISDTLVEDKGTVVANITTEGNANAGRLNSGNASIRFMWDYKTNKVSRAYISGSTNVSDRFLVLEGDAKMYDENGDALSISGLNANEINLVDDQNFVYERTIKVNTGARAKLTAKYNSNVQYFRGTSGAFADGTTVQLLGGEAEGKHTMRIVYDFKTNLLVTAYVPSGTIEDDIAINADLMIVREHQDAGQQLLFNDGSLSEVKTVYGVMRFNRWTLNNKEKTGGHSPVGDPKSPYERALYWISFPFDVNLSDVFGFGTYGTHWIIMEYDGAERAKEGYWRDSEGFWKHVTNRTGKVLKAGKGYVLGLDLDLMKDDNTSFWSNNIEQVELFFPSAKEVEDISSTNVTTTVEEHECKIDRTGNNGSDINKNRTRADSHWNIIGIPSYANYGTTLKDGAEGDVITWNAIPYTNDLPFLYEWSTVDNTYSVQSGTTYPFKSMHAYMVQYHGDLYWSMASATPVSPIVARRTYAEAPQNVEMRLELLQNEQKVDQTFVKLSNDENVSANFAFDEDLCKEYNANKANIYTIVENYLPVAGNTLPMSDQTTIVPVGVKIAATGDYTFAIPDGTSGVGVTLVDTETGIRTSLSALDYTVNLAAGTYDNRFLLEISPIVQTPTDIEAVSDQHSAVRKVMIDGILYIVKDGQVFDARGSRVK